MMSETPVLDLQQPVSTKRHAGLLFYVLSVGFGLLIVAIPVLGIALDVPILLRSMDKLGLLLSATFDAWEGEFFMGGLVAWLAAFLVAVVIHEFAHFLTGRALGFSLQALQIGPISLTYVRGKPKFSFQPGTGVSGFTSMHIQGFARLHRKLLLYVLAGPAINLICGGIGLLLLHSPVAFTPLGAGTLRVFSLASFVAFFTSIAPYRTRNGFFTDGARLRMFLLPNAKTWRWYGLIGIYIQQRAGRRPRDWNRRWLGLSCAHWDDSRDALSAFWLAYAAAHDRDDEPTAGACLETCLRGISVVPMPFRDIVITEAGVFQSWFRNDALKAAQWYARVKKPGALSPILRSRANAMQRFGEHNFDAAYDEWAKGLAIVEELPSSAHRDRLRESWLEWKKEMHSKQSVIEGVTLA